MSHSPRYIYCMTSPWILLKFPCQPIMSFTGAYQPQGSDATSLQPYYEQPSQFSQGYESSNVSPILRFDSLKRTSTFGSGVSKRAKRDDPPIKSMSDVWDRLFTLRSQLEKQRVATTIRRDAEDAILTVQEGQETHPFKIAHGLDTCLSSVHIRPETVENGTDLFLNSLRDLQESLIAAQKGCKSVSKVSLEDDDQCTRHPCQD